MWAAVPVGYANGSPNSALSRVCYLAREALADLSQRDQSKWVLKRNRSIMQGEGHLS